MDSVSAHIEKLELDVLQGPSQTILCSSVDLIKSGYQLELENNMYVVKKEVILLYITMRFKWWFFLSTDISDTKN